MLEKFLSEMSYVTDPALFENCFVILQDLKGKDESKNMDVFPMRIMKFESLCKITGEDTKCEYRQDIQHR